MYTIFDIFSKIRALIRLKRINEYTNLTMSEKFHMFAEKFKALEEFKLNYCYNNGVRTSVISKNERAYERLKNQLKKEIISELYNF